MCSGQNSKTGGTARQIARSGAQPRSLNGSESHDHRSSTTGDAGTATSQSPSPSCRESGSGTGPRLNVGPAQRVGSEREAALAHIDKRKTSTGEWRYEVRYRGPDGKELTETKRTRKEAEARLTDVRSDLQRGTWIDPRRSARSFGEVASEWLADNTDKRPSAWARDESVLRVHLKPAIGQRPIGSLTPDDLRRLVESWKVDHTPRSVKRMYGVLRAILNYAVERELIVVTPCRGVSLPKAQPIACRVVTPDELSALAGALGADYSPMAYLGAVLGLRWGECAGLRVGRVDFLHGRLSVAEQITRGAKGVLVNGPPKSDAGRRTLAVPQPLMAMLAAHLNRRGLTGADEDALLFTMPEGGPLRYERWRRRTWGPAFDAVSLGGLTFHDLRRANATALVLDNIDLKTAQTRLGHSDPRLTLAVYAQASTAADPRPRTLSERTFSAARGKSAGRNRRSAIRLTEVKALTCANGVGVPGFEPGASASRTLRANQAAPHPVMCDR